MPSTPHIFGIRHHGPGSARSLLRALNDLNPDCLLLEGPPDAQEVIAEAVKADMVPPVAILVHQVDDPAHAVYYPFAAFSPEWQAIRWALAANVPVRFMDLPQWHRMPIATERSRALLATGAAPSLHDGSPPEPTADAAPHPTPEPIDPDPLALLAHAAGFDDGERWWEHVVESRGDHGAGIFDQIGEAMAELRNSSPAPRDPDEPLREAWMRRTLRQANREAFERIAIVCGAWHVPALELDAFSKKDDDDRLKNLPKVKTAATWIPWTYDRLTAAGGYGAGVHAPGWYEHLWTHPTAVIESWMTRVARLLREKDIDCSSASVIEAVRLSRSLASFRHRPLADLSDIADATRAVFCFDSDLPLKLIARELLIGDRIGSVPDDTPMVPLAADLQRLQKRLRLKPEASERPLDLDLRNETDLARSVLLHRLRLLGIEWGTPAKGDRGKGTFHELWQLRWEPAFSVKLIEAGSLGSTIEHAAGAQLRKLAADSTDLQALSNLLRDAILAELGAAVTELVQRIESVAAVAADVALLMRTLPQLANTLRYGTVRETDAALVRPIVDGIVPRIAAGLAPAVASLNDDAAASMEQTLRAAHAAIELLQSPEHTATWLDALFRIADPDTVHGLIRGRSTRLLLDANRLTAAEVARRLGLALSRGTDPAAAARWIEGFLSHSGLLLIHDRKLLNLIDDWLTAVHPDTFKELLPLLRRTFATFPAPERRQIGQALKSQTSHESAEASSSVDLDRAAAALPLLRLILGASS